MSGTELGTGYRMRKNDRSLLQIPSILNVWRQLINIKNSSIPESDKCYEESIQLLKLQMTWGQRAMGASGGLISFVLMDKY